MGVLGVVQVFLNVDSDLRRYCEGSVQSVIRVAALARVLAEGSLK